jgi:Leucine Rich repeat
MTDQANPASRPRRRLLRVSVREMILLVLLVGGWLGWYVRSVRIQREAVAAIEKAEGRVWYNWQYKEGISSWHWVGDPWAPGWLVDRLGVDYFGRVVAIDQSGWITHSRSFTDKDMVPVGHLTGLVELRLWSSSVTDAGLAELNRLARVERLKLYGSKVTDAGLIRLRGFSRLKELCLTGSKITDAGLVHLTGMTNLTELDLMSTQVTDAGVKALQRSLPGLTIHR